MVEDAGERLYRKLLVEARQERKGYAPCKACGGGGFTSYLVNGVDAYDYGMCRVCHGSGYVGVRHG